MRRISTARTVFIVCSGVTLAHAHTLAEAAELMQALQPQWRRAISAAHPVPGPSDILGRVGDSAITFWINWSELFPSQAKLRGH